MIKNKKILLNRIDIEPSIAFRFVDNFSTQTIKDLCVTAVVDVQRYWDKPKKAIRSPAGLFTFFGLTKGGKYRFKATAKGFEIWEDSIEIPYTAPENPREERLLPAPSYSFPEGTTLIRGMVKVEPKPQKPVNPYHIELKLNNDILNAETSEEGEFVFYLLAVDEKDKYCQDDQDDQDEVKNQYYPKERCYVKGKNGKENLSFTIKGRTINKLDSKCENTIKPDSEFVWEIGKELHINIFLENGGQSG